MNSASLVRGRKVEMHPMPEIETGNEAWADRLAESLMLRAIGLTEGRPLAARRLLLGAAVRFAVSPLHGWPALVRQNLALVRPDLPRGVRRRLAGAAGWNAGVSLAELLSPREFRTALAGTPVAGPGVAAMKEARRAGRGVVLVTAEIGNPDALVAILAERGVEAAALASPAPATAGGLAGLIEAARARLGGPRHPDTEQGRDALEAHLARGGLAVLQGDRVSETGTPVLLFGARVRTPIFAATAALRQHAEFIPAFALRRRDGRYGVWMAAPVAHAHPGEMMQDYQRAVEEAAREFMEQFFWAGARWRPERYLDRAAPSTGP